MAKITKEIDLQFTAKGLEVIGEQIKKVIPSLPKGKKGKQPGIDLLNRQQALLTQYQKSEGKFDPIATEQFLKDYLNLINSLDSLKTKLVANLTPELQRQREILKDNLAQAESVLQKQRDAIETSKKAVSRDQSGKIIMSKDFTHEQMITIPTEGLTGVTGQSIKNYETILSNKEKAIDIINSLNQKEAINEEQKKIANITTEEEIKLQEILVQKKEEEERIQTNLNVLNKSGNFNYQEAIEYSKGKSLEELLQIKKDVEESSMMSDASNTWANNNQYLYALEYAIQLKTIQEESLKIEQQLFLIKEARNKTQSELIGLTEEEVDKRDKLIEKVKSYDAIIQEMEKRASAQIQTTEEMEKELPQLETNVTGAEEKIVKFDEENLKSGNEQIQQLISSMTELINILKGDYNSAVNNASNSNRNNKNTLDDFIKSNKESTSTVKAATKNIINYTLIFNTLKRLYRETIRTIKELDKSMTDMAIVTEMNREQT